jgi:hypothetical protein
MSELRFTGLKDDHDCKTKNANSNHMFSPGEETEGEILDHDLRDYKIAMTIRLQLFTIG